MSEFFGEEVQVLTITAPIGAMVDWPADVAPTDWMLAQGQALPKGGYPALHAVLGEKFGSGDGSGDEFNLPDCRDRTVVGTSATKLLAATGGAETVTLTGAQMPAHDHGAVGDHTHVTWTGNAGQHTHQEAAFVAGRVQANPGTQAYKFDTDAHGINGYRNTITAAGDHAHAVGMNGAGAHTHASNGGGEAHSNMQPYISLNKIIKVV